MFQVFPSRQDRKTNLSVCFFGEVTAQQFCFQIYWSLDNPKKSVWRTYIQWLWLWTWTWWAVTNCWKIIPFLIMIIAVWRASSKKWPWKTCSLYNSKTSTTRYITFKIFSASCTHSSKICGTGKSLSGALIFASTNPQYTANVYRQTTDKLMFKSVISTVRWIRK